MIVVVYRTRKTAKHKLAVFTASNARVDNIIDGAKRKPPIPANYILDDIGIGESYVESYSKKYNIKINKKMYDPIF